MATSTKLDNYLSALDKELSQISISERAEIITEIKSHILEAQQRDSDKSIDSILSSLGTPEQVASKYLQDRGLSSSRSQKRPLFQWLIIGLFGTFLVMTAAVLALVLVFKFKFSPVIQIDGKHQRVSLADGMIDIDGEAETVRIGSKQISDHSKVINGTKIIDPDHIKIIDISFTNGKWILESSMDHNFSWSCKVDMESPETNLVTENGHTLKLDLSSTMSSKCEIKIPADMSVKLTGGNMKMSVEKPDYNLDVSGANGKIELTPDPKQKYKFDIKAVNGKIDNFESSSAKEALKISISLVNGEVSNASIN